MLLGMNRTSKSVAALYAYLRNVFRAPRLLVSWVPRYLAICVYTCLLLSLRQVASPRIRSATDAPMHTKVPFACSSRLLLIFIL